MTFVRAHATRIYAVAVALLALVAHYVPTLPTALILGVVAAVLGVGEAVQRVEDNKTLNAVLAAFKLADGKHRKE